MSDHPDMKVITCISGFFIGACFIVAVQLVGAESIVLPEQQNNVANASAEKRSNHKKPVFKVTLRPLSDLLAHSTNSVPAAVISLNHTTISAEITGRIKALYAETGDTVKKGEKLASIDCRSYDLALKQAEAVLKVAKTQFNLARKQHVRNRDLVKKGTISRELYDQTDAKQRATLADIELKNVQIESARLAVSRCQIVAPFGGQITDRLVQQGQLVMPATPLFKLLQNDRLEIRANLSPSEIKLIQDSPMLEFVSGGRRFKAELRSVIQSVDETTRTQEARLTLPRNAAVVAGMSGRLEWSSKIPSIPADYLLQREGKLGVMIARKITSAEKIKTAIAQFYPLPDASEGRPAIIDLPKNTPIIDQNRYRVKDGQHVMIAPE